MVRTHDTHVCWAHPCRGSCQTPTAPGRWPRPHTGTGPAHHREGGTAVIHAQKIIGLLRNGVTDGPTPSPPHACITLLLLIQKDQGPPRPTDEGPAHLPVPLSVHPVALVLLAVRVRGAPLAVQRAIEDRSLVCRDHGAAEGQRRGDRERAQYESLVAI
jgi:hypothetical protein